MKRRLLYFAAGLLIADVGASLLYFQATRGAVRERLLNTGSRLPLDAALVFCEGIGPHHGLSKITKLRLKFAANLHRGEMVRHVAGIGGNWKKIQGGRGMRAILREAGVPESAAHGERQSYDTLTNVDALWKMLKEKRWRRIVIISSPIHLHRILHFMEKNPPTAELRTQVFVLPFSHLRGAALALDHWREIHHEWIARGMFLVLPRAWFRGIMRWRRK